MAIDISGIYFFMPVFSFLFVFLITYSILAKTEILGSSGFVNFFLSFIMAIIFMSFSSLDLYVQTIIPWFIVLFIIVFLVLLIAGLSTKDLSKIMTTSFAWVVIVILLIIFLIAAIRVFNPIFHPDLIVTSGEGTSLVEQIRYAIGGRFFGAALLVVIASQIVEEKTKHFKKEISSFTNFKREIEEKTKQLDNRLTKIEGTFEELKLAIIKKIGTYGDDIKNLSHEMRATQNSFSKILDPLTDNIRELQNITGNKSISKEQTKKPAKTPITKTKKNKNFF